MAGLSTKDIKLRIRSMESTKQITRAMEMVAASKLRRAQERALTARPYFETLYETMCSIAAAQRDEPSPYFRAPQATGRVCYIVIAGDRGLAGGYNSNILKLVWEQMQQREACVVPIGKKALEFFRLRQADILTAQYAEAADVTVGDCFSMARMLARDFAAERFDKIVLAYTAFVSVLQQQPKTLTLLPLEPVQKAAGEMLTLCEPDAETVLSAIIPEYLGGLVYGALCESVASEQAARRTAMDSATKNAEDMIADLSLQYNRARQGAITQEITEIVAGSEH